MEQLFKCETVYQRKIMEWLVEQGITGADISTVQLLDRNKVQITNPAGQYMVLICNDLFQVGIDKEPAVQLRANKTSLIKLLKTLGYSPTTHAQFSKAPRSRSWWLEWLGEDGRSYRASLLTSMGKPLLGMTIDGSWNTHSLTLGDLQKHGLIQIKDKVVEK